MGANRLPYGLKVLNILSYLRLANVLLTASILIGLSKVLPVMQSFISGVFQPQQYIAASISFITIVSVLISIHRRNATLHMIGMVGFGLTLLISLYNLIGVQFTVMISGFLLTVPQFFILWYWIQMKPYFEDHSLSPDSDFIVSLDRLVNPFLIGWIILTVSVMTFATLSRLQTGIKVANEAKVYEKAFETKSFKERNDYCLLQPTEQSRDICLFYGFKYTKNKSNITVESCNLIKSVGLRTTCYATIGECSLVTDTAMKELCEYTKKK